MTRREWLLGGAAAGLLAGCEGGGCNRSSSSTSGPSGASGPKAPSEIGYSNVATLDATEARWIVEAGLTLMAAELIPFDFSGDRPLADVTAQWARIKGAVSVARSAGATTWITLVNWNGAAQRAQTDAWFQAQLDTAIREIGPAGVWLEGVTEPEGAKALHWQQMTVAQWPGTTVQNRTPVGADLTSVHYCYYDRLLAAVKSNGSVVHSTDCTPALASNLSLGQVTEVTREAVQRRRRLLLYDTADRVPSSPAANRAVIEAMAAVIREGA